MTKIATLAAAGVLGIIATGRFAWNNFASLLTEESTKNASSASNFDRSTGHHSFHRGKRLELLHITNTGGHSLEILAAQHNVSWGACHFMARIDGMPKGVSCPGPIEEPLWSSLPGVPLWHAPPRYLHQEELRWLDDAQLFTVVRNPYDRVVSSYKYNHKRSRDVGAMNDWLMERLTQIDNGRPRKGTEWRQGYFGQGILVPQMDYIDENVRILRLESIHHDFIYMLREYGIDWKWEQERRNKTGPGHLTAANLTNDILRLINRVYRQDFQELGYPIRDVVPAPAHSDKDKSHRSKTEDEVIVKHSSMGGRVGNQLFEHAATLALANETGKQACIVGGNVDLLDKYFVGPFNRNCGDVPRPQHVGQKGYGIYTPVPKSDGSVQISGYLQSWKYFAGAKAEIKRAFAIKPEYMEQVHAIIGEDSNSTTVNVGIHLRYDANLFYLINPPEEYYFSAMDHFRRKYRQQNKEVRFYVASNDVARSKRLGVFVSDDSVTFLEGSSAIVDFGALMSCDGMILSMGSFGWWAAWLGPHQRNGDVLYYSFNEVFNMTDPVNLGRVRQEDYFPPEWKEILHKPRGKAEEGRKQLDLPVEDKLPSVDISKANNTDSDGGGVLSSSCGVLITSQGGVGSSAFMELIEKIFKDNPEALVINFPDDSDGFKHKPATYWKHHDRHAIVGNLRVGGGKNYRTARVCFSKVLVIIGDPIHTIESTYRRWKLVHLNKLRTGSNLGAYPGGTSLTQIYQSIARSGKDEVGISNYILSWRHAQNDREHWPEVRLVTSKTLHNNAVDMAQWVGVKEKHLQPFESLSYNESKHHKVDVEDVDEETMEKVKRAYDHVMDIVDSIENGRARSV